MKVPAACRDRYSSSSAGELVGQLLGSLCLQYVVMDRSQPAVASGLQQDSYVSPVVRQPEQSLCDSERLADAVVGEGSHRLEGLLKSPLLHESAGLFRSASDNLNDAPETWRRETSHTLPSTRTLSSCIEPNEIELVSAEVNPVTFEAFPPAAHNERRIDSVASISETRERRGASRLADEVDLASDGVSSHSAVCASESRSGRPPSPSAIPVSLERMRAKLMCSFGGRIVSRSADGKLRYVGGETRILAVNRAIGYDEFMSKMADLYGAPLTLKYQLPDEHLDALISISSDDDFQNMLEEYDKLEFSGGVSRLRLFFFTSTGEHEMSQRVSRSETEDCSVRVEQRHGDRNHNVQERIFDTLREVDETGFRQGERVEFGGPGMFRVDSGTGPCWSVSPVQTFVRAPVAPSSPPLSPSAAIRQAHLKPLLIGESSYQFPKERLDHGVIQTGLGSPSRTSRVDHQYCKPADSPSRTTQYESSVPRGENWLAQAGMRRVNSQTRLMRQADQQMDQAGMRRVNSQTRLMRQSDQQMDCGMVAVPQASDVPVLAVERQRLVYQQHKCIPQQQGPWQSPADGNLVRSEVMQRRPSDVHKQPHAYQRQREAVHQWHQGARLCVRQTAPDYDERALDMDPQGIPQFCQASSYQMGSTTSSPRIIDDCNGRCNCAQQHSQVHRGVNVRLTDDQAYSRRVSHKYGLLPHYGDQPTRRHGLPDSLGLHDNVSHCVERMTWFPHNGDIATSEVLSGNAWWQVSDTHTSQCHLAEYNTNNRVPQYCDSPFSSSHDHCHFNKTRCPHCACCDGRNDPAVLPVYAGIQEQVGGWGIHQRSKDVDSGIAYSVEERPGAEGALQCKNAQGDNRSKLGLAMAVGHPYHGNFTVRMLPTNLLSSEDSKAFEPSTTWSHVGVMQHSKLVTPNSSAVTSSGNNPSGEARDQTGTHPSASSASNPVPSDDFFKSSLSEGMPTTDWTIDSLLGKDGHSELEKDACTPLFRGNHDKVQLGVRNNCCMLNPASRTVEEAASEQQPHVPSLAYARLVNGCKIDQMNSSAGHVQGISAGPLASVRPASISANQECSLEKLSKSTLTKGQSNVGNNSSPSHAFTNNLQTGGTISEIPKSCLNVELCDESRQVDHDVVDVNLRDDNKAKTEQSTKVVMKASKSNSPSSKLGKDHSLRCSDAVVELLNESVTKEQLPEVVPQVPHNRTEEECAYEEKDVTVGNVGVEGTGIISSQTEVDEQAQAHGLQIIQNDDLEDLKELGSGTFGTVFHGKWRGSDVAIKRIKASCFIGRPSERDRLISDFWREAHTLSQLHHPNVVAFYGVVPDGPEGALATITEYMVNGSLKKVLRKKDRTIDRRKRLIIAMGAAFGMEYLHSKNIVHFDLKCDNLLVNMKDAQRPVCKVGDFGLSKVKHRTMVSGGVRGTIPWMAPELLRGSGGMVTEKIDVFSFGIVMWELLTGEEPYASMHHGAIIGGIINDALRPSIPSWCEPGWRALMERCWSGDPSNRPSFSEVATELRALAASINVR